MDIDKMTPTQYQAYLDKERTAEIERYIGVLDEKHTEDLKILKEGYTSIIEKLDSHSEKLDSHKEMIGSMMEDISVLKEDVSVLKKDMTEVKGDIKDIRNILETKVDQKEFMSFKVGTLV